MSETVLSLQNVNIVQDNRTILKNLNLEVHRGEFIYIIGKTGSGKSSLMKTLYADLPLQEGQGRIVDYDLAKLRERDIPFLRRKIGIIFQDYIRYQMSFAQNIAVGNVDEMNNRALVEQSAEKSLANLLAKKLPNQYDQALGRRFNNGVELSGGEWQKVALARAYMKESQLLILDEPTSALDARAEYEVFQRFAELTKGKTAVLISHRFSTVRMADRILVLDKGTLLEIGSHEELLALGGRYAELFLLQAKGYR